MKIQLPNPSEYIHKEEQFWDQLELSIYHAKKSWEKIRRTYTEEEIKNENYPWLSFSHEDHIEEAIDGKEKIEYEDRQSISIEINEP
jgi:flagellar biosynthesis chaperone FliJ